MDNDPGGVDWMIGGLLTVSFLVLASVAYPGSSASARTRQSRDASCSELGPFLGKAHRGAFESRSLGSITGIKGTIATFRAVSAFDAAEPAYQVRVLEVGLDDGVRRETICLKDDRLAQNLYTLGFFQEVLAHVVAEEKAKDSEGGRGMTAPASNWAPPGPGPILLNAGWWRTLAGQTFTVIDTTSEGHLSYFPANALEELCRIVSLARTFLEAPE